MFMAQDRKIPAPVVNPENKPFFDAASSGKLMIKKCSACGEHHYYPRAICPHCFSDKTSWTESAGNGIIYSYSVMRRGTPVPYAIAYVTLAEGVTMLTNIVDCDLDAIRIGQAVRVVFKPTEGGATVPMFAPKA
ncbi:MAG: Zn-ribbon domain-containing OB-fold protein [Burkholderiales bacterium]